MELEGQGESGKRDWLFFFFFKQKTAYEMCGRDWSSDVCSSDLLDKAITALAAVCVLAITKLLA